MAGIELDDGSSAGGNAADEGAGAGADAMNGGAAAGSGASNGAGGVAGRDPFGLSPRELEVLALLAAGRTNRQIGDELFISPKTASVHVTHILDKLGVRAESRRHSSRHGREWRDLRRVGPAGPDSGRPPPRGPGR